MKILVAFGTRPEAIKMCPVICALKRQQNMKCVVCLTGQHREMLLSVMERFHIEANYNLDVMKPNQALCELTERLLSGIKGILETEKPHMVLVHGDTTSAFAVALACFYQNIPVGHVEAGLRTYNLKEPFPEEFNRQVVDKVSALCFAPTMTAKENLISEGVTDEQIYVTGNTVIDAMRMTISKDYTDDNLKWAEQSRWILLTSHRRENIGEPMKHIFKAVRKIADRYKNIRFLYPVHKNPLVKKIADDILQGHPRIRLIESLDMDVFYNYMANCYFVMTDSGGVQEEAPSLGKPVLVLRNTTERPEGIEAGTLRLVGTDEESIITNCCELLDNEETYNSMSKANNPYGDGHASERIVETIIEWEGLRNIK
ncbi:MAG: UDP-N-acetylglucosamine 2-epimerase (non-hydrolyzing) [Lachnospiraceae bacterium]|nr:UDP-N-acetylglucosamine 2-epimerase (non-hydrolyzing) [Lachnospiraceae bacterium]